MSRSKACMSITLLFVIAALVSVIALAGCAPQQSTSSSDSSSTSTEEVSSDGMYVSDEQCMSCHGGTYESVAELTSDLGEWNPHNSIHGGYNSCVNCHAKDKEVTYNYCTQCHTYEPGEEPIFL